MDKYARGQKVKFIITNFDHAQSTREKLKEVIGQTGTIVSSLGFEINEWRRSVRRPPKPRQYRYYNVQLDSDGRIVEEVPEDALAPLNIS